MITIFVMNGNNLGYMLPVPAGVSYGVSYVVASDPTEAYNKVREFLDAKDLGFRHERELSQIDLLAEAYQYNNVGCMLYL